MMLFYRQNYFNRTHIKTGSAISLCCLFLTMFLNDIGQPLILDPKKAYGPYEQHNGPMLLTSAAFQDHTVPANWCRRIFGSAEDVARFKSELVEPAQEYEYGILRPNEPTEIEYGGTKILLTLISAGQNEANENATLYYLKNDYIRAIIADNLTGFLDFIPKAGASFHHALGNGIDVMYIDDNCYVSDEAEALEQREHIYALVQLIRPKCLYGLRWDKLPKSLLDLCAQKDTFTLPAIENQNKHSGLP